MTKAVLYRVSKKSSIAAHKDVSYAKTNDHLQAAAIKGAECVRQLHDEADAPAHGYVLPQG